MNNAQSIIVSNMKKDNGNSIKVYNALNESLTESEQPFYESDTHAICIHMLSSLSGVSVDECEQILEFLTVVDLY